MPTDANRLLTAVIGPAGSGKTHFVREMFADESSVWLTLRPHHHAVETAGHLVRRLHARLGDFPSDLVAAVGSTSGPTIDADPLVRAERLAAHVTGALDAVADRDLVIVFDDADRLDGMPGPSRFIESLVLARPHRIRFVFATRTAIRFGTGRLRHGGHVDEIGPAALALRDDDAQKLATHRAEVCGATFDIADELPAEQVDRIVEWSAGNPGALIAATALASIGDAVPLGTGPTNDPDALAATTKQLVGALDDATRLVLDDLVVLDGAATGDLSRLAHDEVDRRLDQLVAAGLVERPSDSAGRFRPTRSAAMVAGTDPDRLTERAERASTVAIERGDVRRALGAAMHGAHGTIVGALDAYGARVVDQGEPQLVIDAISSLPPDARARFHGLAGRAHQALGDWTRALERFEQVDERTTSAADAWRHGLIRHLQGDAQGALATYERAFDRTDDRNSTGDTAILYGYAGAAAWLIGDSERAADLSRRSMAIATTTGSDVALAVAHTGAALVAASEGDRTGNEWHYGQALRHAELAGDTLQIARIRMNRGSRLMEEGDFASALAELDRAVRAADVGSYGTFLAIAMSNRGEVLTKLGRLDEAHTDLSAAVALLQSQGARVVAYPLSTLARLLVVRGDIEQALGACERARALSDDGTDRQLAVAVTIQQARAVATRDLDAAWSIVEPVTTAARGSLDEAELLTVVADVADRRGDTERAREAIERARQLARVRHDRFALAGALEVASRIGDDDVSAREQLTEARAIFDEIGCVLDVARVDLALAAHEADAVADATATAVGELARRLGARPLARAAEQFLRRHDAEPRPPLAVTMLGSFAVERDGESVPISAWQSKKARDLFKMLVARSGRPVTRERAIDRLWPGEDAAKMANRLSAALATIRSVLDPDKRYPSEHYVRANSEAIVLEAGAAAIDVDDFLVSARAALEAHQRDVSVASTMLAAVEASYSGDVLEDDPYDDWYVPLREEARSVYLNVVRTLALRRRVEGDGEDAIRLLLRLLEREPFDEPAHLELVSDLSRAGRHGDARRRHQIYATRMRELDIEPQPFTT